MLFVVKIVMILGMIAGKYSMCLLQMPLNCCWFIPPSFVVDESSPTFHGGSHCFMSEIADDVNVSISEIA